ncbi:hypothetical protein ACIF8R_15645 [Acinetobacter sp. ABJ_C4_1]|uniref:hypothetical protein n=1 Tax=Acinetobacter sp. ABJ_C4_1 TaxID=3377080 RepID=UPI0037CA30BA
MNSTLNTAIAVAILSAGISFLIQYFFKRYDSRIHAKTIKKAIISEITATLKLIEKRRYSEFLQECIHELATGKTFKVLASIEQQQNLFPVYKSNIDKIGVLNANLASKIVMFYALLESVLVDTNSKGLLNNAEYSTLEAFQETFAILNEAIALGNEIIQNK